MKKNIIIFSLCLLLILTGFILDNFFKKEIIVIDDGKQIKFNTFRDTFEELQEVYDFNIGKYDKISVKKDETLDDKSVIEIYRSFNVKINHGEKTLKVDTNKIKVSDLLKRENIVFDEDDLVYPDRNAIIEGSCNINITTVDYKTEIVEEKIPYYTIIKFNDDLEEGNVVKKSDGENGLRELEYQVRYEDGKEISRKIINTKILKEPVDEIVERSKNKFFITSRGQSFRVKKIYIMEATAYDLSYASTQKLPSHPEYGITYSGTQARPGVVAVDPDLIDLGSKLYVESLDGAGDYGFASAEDIGSAIQGNRIDLFISNHSKAMAYGRRNVRVYVLEEKIPEDRLKGFSERWIYGSYQ